MAIVSRFASVHVVRSGCGSVSGSYGFGAIRLNADVWLWICVLDDNSVYIAPNGGSMYWNGAGLSHGHSWPLYIVGDIIPFTDTLPNDRDLHGWLLGDVSSWSYYHCTYYLPALNSPVLGEPLPSEWGPYRCKYHNINDWEYVSPTERAYYLAFPANNRGGNVNQIQYSSARIVFYAPEVFDPTYYPGKIYTTSWDNSVANSCNRDGGYFKRLDENRLFIDRKNNLIDPQDSTVWLHDGADWNIVAPLIGRR